MASSETAKAGRRRREAKRRALLAERGIVSLTVLAPEPGHAVLKDAAGRMRDGADPREAARAAGGANQAPEDGRAAELAEAESQLSDAGELIDRLYRNRGIWKERAQKAESEVQRIRKMPGLLPSIARKVLGIRPQK